ncbi:RNA polymerase sigma factor [Agrococcus jejuensis]|uniref:RNA polymerase sigma factor n=1 Tax=Agrococcus jejuensis TaxID=399736 RepID=A0A1G8DLL3_9MICO|nr:sigma-70 family RNA polymerase sigma factor [Agrococcus jejuensis]SDH58300.1 RNA polymerase sigma-70 factor, ECF subfamily [Agrococcus jejuensis]
MTATEGFDDDAIALAFATGPSDVGLRLAYDRWGGLVLALALRVMDRADAEDVVQQTFVSAWRSRERYDPEAGPLGAWIVRIARRRIADHFRVASVLHERVVDPTVVLDRAERPHPVDVPDAVAGSILVEQTLAEMDEPQRTIVRLAVIEDLPASAIAERLELPVGTVKSHLSRTLRRLRDRWEGAHAAHLA